MESPLAKPSQTAQREGDEVFHCSFIKSNPGLPIAFTRVRPMKEGVQLLNAVQEVYLSPEVTVA
jgi:hypothetical protein